jgi:hypothetical protein
VIRGSVLFEPYNHDPLHDPKVNLICDDGRNFLLATDRTYDVITSDPIDPDDAGVTSLYSKEYYELVRSRLRDGGVACQWLTTQYDPDEYKMLVRTFCSVFPETSIWYADYTTILVGVKGAPRVTMADLRIRFEVPSVRKSLEVIGISRPEELLPLCLADPEGARAFVGKGPLNTDDRPLIEYLGPRYSREGFDVEAERTVWKPLIALRSPDMEGWIADWSAGDQTDTAPYYDVMTDVLRIHRLRFESWGEYSGGRDLSPDEKERRYLVHAQTRAERKRKIFDLTWDILGSPAPGLHLILAGLGAKAKQEMKSKDKERIYEAAMEQAFTAWQNGDYKVARNAYVDASMAVPSDRRAALMGAACLDRDGDLTGAMKALLEIDLSGVGSYSEMPWFAHDFFILLLQAMEESDDQEALGRFLLDITPRDEDRPPPSRRSAYGRDGKEKRPPNPKPTEENASEVIAWQLWFKDAEYHLEVGEGVFIWRN